MRFASGTHIRTIFLPGAVAALGSLPACAFAGEDALGEVEYPALEMSALQTPPASLETATNPAFAGLPSPSVGPGTSRAELLLQKDALRAAYSDGAKDLYRALSRLQAPGGQCPAGTKNEVCRCMIMDGAPTVHYVPAANAPEFCQAKELRDGMQSGRVYNRILGLQAAADAAYRKQREILEKQLESLRAEAARKSAVIDEALSKTERKPASVPASGT